MVEDRGIEPAKLGNAQVFGERGKSQVAPLFLERLAGLTPSQRRVALARACVLPWQDKPADMPACFRRELETAAWEASEEDRARERDSDPTASILEDFSSTNQPINRIFLRQIVRLSPTRRRARLAAACAAPWLVKGEKPPEWISRNDQHARDDAAEEHRIYYGESQVA